MLEYLEHAKTMSFISVQVRKSGCICIEYLGGIVIVMVLIQLPNISTV